MVTGFTKEVMVDAMSAPGFVKAGILFLNMGRL